MQERARNLVFLKKIEHYGDLRNGIQWNETEARRTNKKEKRSRIEQKKTEEN